MKSQQDVKDVLTLMAMPMHIVCSYCFLYVVITNAAVLDDFISLTLTTAGAAAATDRASLAASSSRTWRKERTRLGLSSSSVHSLRSSRRCLLNGAKTMSRAP
uniref:Uncharacterized protein n=1 Tax=Oryza meridionalis TaxID=40149 RepID=A0A0E0CD60_9ORYZ